MEGIDWTNQYCFMDEDDLEKELEKYLNSGFAYFPLDPLFGFANHVRTPKGNLLIRLDIERILSRKLIFGDKEQIEAIKAAEFFKVAEAYYEP